MAERLGTSKSRILAYEHGRSVPEPKRIIQLAGLFNVHPRELTGPTDMLGMPSIPTLPELAELRRQAGLTMAQAAAVVGISRSSYAGIEREALLPVRDDGAVRMKLATALNVRPNIIDQALLYHPAASARQSELIGHLENIFKRAHQTHVPAVVDVTEPVMQRIAPLIQRPPQIACRLVNGELEDYRGLLREQARTGVDLAYAQSSFASSRLAAQKQRLDAAVDQAAAAAARSLTRFLSQALNVRQWRLMAVLSEYGPDGLPPALASHYAKAHPEDFNALSRRRYVVGTNRSEGAIALSGQGHRHVHQHFHRYTRLYPRVNVPHTPYSVRYALSRPPSDD